MGITLKVRAENAKTELIPELGRALPVKCVVLPSSNLITLSWDSISLNGLGSFLIQDVIDGSQINVDMSKKNSIKLSKSAHKTLKIKVKLSIPTSL